MKRILSVMLVIGFVACLFPTYIVSAQNIQETRFETDNRVVASWLSDKAKKLKKEAEEAARKAKEAAEKAADKTQDWTEGAVKDTENWTKGAIEDTENWTKGAMKDAAKWSLGAAKDIEESIIQEKKNSELSTLPVLTVVESKMTNFLSLNIGAFTNLKNVQQKKLKTNTYTKLKNELGKIKIPGYMIDFVLDKAIGVDGNNVGGAIADMLPGSVLYGDQVAKTINKVVNQSQYEKINLYKEPIKPKDNLEGFTAYYDIPTTRLKTKSNLQIIVTGLKYGKRDNFNVNVCLVDKNGKETQIPVVKKALNKKEVAFEAKIAKINSSVNKVRIKYINSFNKPKEPSKLIADGIKDAINGVSPGSPISNATRDQIVTILNKLDLNELGANGDVGTIIAENIVGQIPLVGTSVKLVGGNKWLANIVRKVVGQAEVKSYANISNARILINSKY